MFISRNGYNQNGQFKLFKHVLQKLNRENTSTFILTSWDKHFLEIKNMAICWKKEGKKRAQSLFYPFGGKCL